MSDVKLVSKEVLHYIYRKLGKFRSRFNFVSEYNYENKKHEIFYQTKNNNVRINRAMKTWINGQIHVYIAIDWKAKMSLN